MNPISLSQIENRTIRMAICYDFDKTLSPDDMQSFTLIPSFGVDKGTFWKECNDLARENLMDNNLSWMYQLVKYSQFKGQSLRRDYFRKIGADVPLFPGLDGWFDRLTEYAAARGLILEHYVISSGLKEIIEGSAIAPKLRRIYASTFLYSPDGVAIWPAQAVNYTNKTQFIYRIAKGILEEWDGTVNDSMPEDRLAVPYENIVYIGDSETDVPCMKLVGSRGGWPLGVYDPQSGTDERVKQLFAGGRIRYYAPADYTDGSPLSRYLESIIDETAAREKIRTAQKILKEQAQTE